jgi:hypothetical protein
MAKILGFVGLLVGFLLIAGTAGSDDYWEACHRAVDCVAGDPPSLVGEIFQALLGAIMMILGFFAVTAND